MQSLLSQRIQHMSESATLLIHKEIQYLKSQGTTIYDLSIGEPNFATPSIIQEGAKKAIDTGQYCTYPPIAGYKDLREAIAHKLWTENQIPCTPEQIIVSNGAKQALYNLFMCLFDPGDEVIIFTPYWVSYLQMTHFAGAKPIFLKGSLQSNFEPTIDTYAALSNSIHLLCR